MREKGRKRNMLITLVLTLCMMAQTAVTPVSAVSVVYEACEHHTHTPECGGYQNACTDVCEECIAKIQQMIDALPEVKDITNENKGDVMSALTAIDESKSVITDATREKLVWDKYQMAALAVQTPGTHVGFKITKAYSDGIDGPQASFAFVNENNENAVLIGSDFMSTVDLAQPVANGEGAIYYMEPGTYTLEEIVQGDWNMSMTVNGIASKDHTFTGVAGCFYDVLVINSRYSRAEVDENIEHGTVRISSPEDSTYIMQGQDVVCEVVPHDGFRLNKITVTDATGEAVPCVSNSETEYYFTMPGSDVTISATFVCITHAAYEEGICTVCGAECEHEEGEVLFTGENDRKPTCTEKGAGHTECVICEMTMSTSVEVEEIGHSGGTATCKSGAECATCHEIYGDLDKNNHVGETEIVGAKEATATTAGYTGDVCCKDCGAKLEAGRKIPALGAPKVGTKKYSDDGKAFYKVTKSDLKSGTVTYMAPKNKKVTTVTIPATVTIDGVKFKVTAIANAAFKDCTKLKTVIIGKNVSKIGKQAFYGCKKLKNITIKTSKLTLKNVGKNAFKGTSAKATIKVPKKKYKAYKTILTKRGINKKANVVKN